MRLYDEYVGSRVRLTDGREGTLESIGWDNSCSDPDCCGGPFPSTAYVRFDDGEFEGVSESWDCAGEFPEIEAVLL